jgi:hypothetical protein
MVDLVQPLIQVNEHLWRTWIKTLERLELIEQDILEIICNLANQLSIKTTIFLKVDQVSKASLPFNSELYRRDIDGSFELNVSWIVHQYLVYFGYFDVVVNKLFEEGRKG